MGGTCDGVLQPGQFRQLKSVLGTQADDLTRKKNCPQTTHEGDFAEELPPDHS